MSVREKEQDHSSFLYSHFQHTRAPLCSRHWSLPKSLLTWFSLPANNSPDTPGITPNGDFTHPQIQLSLPKYSLSTGAETQSQEGEVSAEQERKGSHVCPLPTLCFLSSVYPHVKWETSIINNNNGNDTINVEGFPEDLGREPLGLSVNSNP